MLTHETVLKDEPSGTAHQNVLARHSCSGDCQARPKTAKVMLAQRFQEAIDRAAMRAGKGGSDAYMEETGVANTRTVETNWRLSPKRPRLDWKRRSTTSCLNVW